MSKMQGEENLRIMECLRGRLVAERAASRAAKENAELMDNKLKELEKQLKDEIKLRKMAEKKLNLLRKKLEALKIPFSTVSDASEKSASSVSSISEMSCISSISSNTCLNNNNQLDNDQSVPKHAGTSNASSVTGETKADIVGTDHVEQKLQDMEVCEQSGMGSDGDFSVAQQQLSDRNHDGLGAEALDKDNNKHGNEEDEHELEHVDNSMALVLVEFPIETANLDYGVQEFHNDKVREVLDTLKHIKDNIQSTLERRRLINVA